VSWRARLIAIARQRDVLLIEDAAYAFLVEDAPPPLKALAPELTVYVSGFSKNVATGLRLGYMVAPLDRIAAIERAIRATAWNTPGVMTALVCGWIEDGTVLRLEAEKRHDAQARQTLGRQLLNGLNVVSHPASYFMWLPLPEDARADQMVRELLSRNVAVSPAEPFATTSAAPHAIRLALGSLDREALAGALREVASTIGRYVY
jgi:DNA-binding transcriptional MocR family regulator